MRDLVEQVLLDVVRATGDTWNVEGHLAAGAQGGAWLLTSGHSARSAVLKTWRGDRELGAVAELIACGRDRGWRTPEWLAWRDSSPSFVLQEYIEGLQPTCVDELVVAGTVDLLDVQRSVSCAAPATDWSAYTRSVVFDDELRIRAALRSFSAEASALVAQLDSLLSTLAEVPFEGDGIVHGDFDVDNLLLDAEGKVIAVIDAQDAGVGNGGVDAGRFLNGCWLWGVATDAAKEKAFATFVGMFGLGAMTLGSIMNVLTLLAFMRDHGATDSIDAICRAYAPLLDLIRRPD